MDAADFDPKTFFMLHGEQQKKIYAYLKKMPDSQPVIININI